MGITYRPATLDDVDAIHRVIRAAETADDAPMASPREEVVEDFGAPDLDPTLDTLVALDAGAIVGYSLAYPIPSEQGKQRTFVFGSVHPDHRGRGVGTHFVEWQTRRASEILAASDTSAEKVIRTFLWEWQNDARALYERHGYEVGRWFETMIRPLDQQIPDSSLPDGLTMVAMTDELSERTRIAHNAAFRDHWGSSEASPQFWQHRFESATARKDLSRAVLDGDTVVGYVLNGVFPDDEQVTGRRDGWIETVGTLPEYRGRGIASALINESLRAFAAEGLTHGGLGVDSDSPTNAHTLYARLGFETIYRSMALVRHYEESP